MKKVTQPVVSMTRLGPFEWVVSLHCGHTVLLRRERKPEFASCRCVTCERNRK